MKHSFEANWKKKNSALCGTKGKKENVIFLLFKIYKEDKLQVFSRMIIWVLQLQRIEVFRVEDLATGFCGEVVFVPRDIIVFYQFIVNSGFGYNLSIVISILL